MRRKLAMENDADLITVALHIRVTKEQILNLFWCDNVHCSSDVASFVLIIEAAVHNIVAVVQVAVCVARYKGSQLRIRSEMRKIAKKDANFEPKLRLGNG
jgi:hypothetical protein